MRKLKQSVFVKHQQTYVVLRNLPIHQKQTLQPKEVIVADAHEDIRAFVGRWLHDDELVAAHVHVLLDALAAVLGVADDPAE